MLSIIDMIMEFCVVTMLKKQIKGCKNKLSMKQNKNTMYACKLVSEYQGLQKSEQV